MWTISADDVEQAKDRIARRRVEIESRYAAEKNALAAESEAIEALECAAAAFVERHCVSEVATAPSPATPPATAGSWPSAAAEPDEMSASEPAPETAAELAPSQPEAEIAAALATETEPATAGEPASSYDILKPGSRWRLNRAARLLNPDGAIANPHSGYPVSES